MKRWALCIVYVSEAVDAAVLDAISSTVKDQVNSNSWILHSFRDIAYNRTSFYIAGITNEVLTSALSLCRKSFDL